MSLKSFLIWLAAGMVAASAIGGAAAAVHLTGYAPAGVVSIAVGAILGIALAQLARFAKVECRTGLVLGAIMLSLVTVLTEHAWLYASFRRQWHEARAKSPHIAMFRSESPWSPGEYFSRELTAKQVTLWVADALLIAGASTIITAIAASRSETAFLPPDP